MLRVEANKQRKEMYCAQKYIGKNLKLLRHIRGVSQETVSGLLHMSRSCYSCLENGMKTPDFETIYILSRFYDVSLDYLLSFDISEHLMSLLRAESEEKDALYFIEQYVKLSFGAKHQIRSRMAELLEKEGDFNKYPWNYEAKEPASL